jgi:hypothetical protein
MSKSKKTFGKKQFSFSLFFSNNLPYYLRKGIPQEKSQKARKSNLQYKA